MCGPTGIGVLYGRQEVLEAMPPYQGGGEMILNVEYPEEHLETQRRIASKPARRTSPARSDLHAAMDYLDAIGREKISQHDQELGAYALRETVRPEEASGFSARTSAGRAW